ncbi:hypothetical protein H0H92_008007 [Tricholoma furcatifolium]|nr:hypothetical protein H0H92_008007 [Tricholoma furcatifolium]
MPTLTGTRCPSLECINSDSQNGSSSSYADFRLLPSVSANDSAPGLAQSLQTSSEFLTSKPVLVEAIKDFSQPFFVEIKPLYRLPVDVDSNVDGNDGDVIVSCAIEEDAEELSQSQHTHIEIYKSRPISKSGSPMDIDADWETNDLVQVKAQAIPDIPTLPQRCEVQVQGREHEPQRWGDGNVGVDACVQVYGETKIDVDVSVQAHDDVGVDVGIQAQSDPGVNAGVQAQEVQVVDAGVMTQENSWPGRDVGMMTQEILGVHIGVQAHSGSGIDVSMMTQAIPGVDASVQTREVEALSQLAQSHIDVAVQTLTRTTLPPVFPAQRNQYQYRHRDLLATKELRARCQTNDLTEAPSVVGTGTGTGTGTGIAKRKLGALIDAGAQVQKKQTKVSTEDSNGRGRTRTFEERISSTLKRREHEFASISFTASTSKDTNVATGTATSTTIPNSKKRTRRFFDAVEVPTLPLSVKKMYRRLNTAADPNPSTAREPNNIVKPIEAIEGTAARPLAKPKFIDLRKVSNLSDPDA